MPFLCDFGPEALYGGAAGGGKSDALLMAALMFVEIPGYRALLMRRTLPMLEQDEGLIQRSKEWIRDRADYSEQKHRWTFPSGATLKFQGLDQDKHLFNVQGGAYHFVGFDELSQFPENYYRYLFSRQRKLEGCNIPLRMRAGSNPGGISHEFIKRRFINPGGIPFYPAKLADNPGIDQKSYIRGMNKLDPITRAQLLAGDWDAYEGGRFQKRWFKEFWVEERPGGHWAYVLDDGAGNLREYRLSTCWQFAICDPAARVGEENDYTAIGVFGVTPDRDILILEVVREKIPIDKIVPRIAKLCAEYDPAWVGIEDTGFQIAIVNAARKHEGIPAVRGLQPEGKDKLVRATPAMIRAEAGQIFVPQHGRDHPWVEDFIAECVHFTGDPDQDAHDDQVDMLAYGVQSLERFGLAGGPVIIETDEEEEDKQDGTHGYFGARR